MCIRDRQCRRNKLNKKCHLASNLLPHYLPNHNVRLYNCSLVWQSVNQPINQDFKVAISRNNLHVRRQCHFRLKRAGITVWCIYFSLVIFWALFASFDFGIRAIFRDSTCMLNACITQSMCACSSKFRKVLRQQTWGQMATFLQLLLQFISECTSENYQNRSIFAKVITKNCVIGCFYRSQCIVNRQTATVVYLKIKRRGELRCRHDAGASAHKST